MLVKQISVFVENKPGRLAKLTRALADSGIDLIAICIADTVDFGILRCIVDDPDKAVDVLKKSGFTASTTKVLAVELPDKPGGLAAVLGYLSEADIDVEYIYSFVRSRKEKALILFKVDNPDRAIEILSQKQVPILCMDDIMPIK